MQTLHQAISSACWQVSIGSWWPFIHFLLSRIVSAGSIRIDLLQSNWVHPLAHERSLDTTFEEPSSTKWLCHQLALRFTCLEPAGDIPCPVWSPESNCQDVRCWPSIRKPVSWLMIVACLHKTNCYVAGPILPLAHAQLGAGPLGRKRGSQLKVVHGCAGRHRG